MDFIVNVFELRVSPIGTRAGSKAITFKHTELDSIALISSLLLSIKNKVEDVVVYKAGKWTPTRQGLYLHNLKSDDASGVFYGGVEVGSTGSFHRLRNRDGKIPYDLTSNDLSMRDYFFRLEMPPDSKLGFLVVQRHGRNTAANAIQQSIRRQFHSVNYTAHFRLVTDENEFDNYLSGRVAAVRALYVPQKAEAREAVKKSLVLGAGLRRKDREDMDIKLKVNRPITQQLKKEIKKWLTSDESNRPKIVTLPVEDDPDRLILLIEGEDGKQKQLHPGMIADMALTLDLTGKVKRSHDGRIDLESANAEAGKVCASQRAALA